MEATGNTPNHHCIYLVCAGLVFTVVAAAVVQTKDGDDRTRKERSRVHAAAVYAIALLLWPVVLEKTVGFSRITEHPWLLGSGFVWAALLMAWELTSNMDETRSGDAARHKSAETKSFAGVVIGAAWAVGTLLGALRKSGDQSVEAVSYTHLTLPTKA